jgi:hypothetical protein
MNAVKEQYPLVTYTSQFLGKYAKRWFQLDLGSERILGVVRSFLATSRPTWDYFISIMAALSNNRVVSTFKNDAGCVSQAIVLIWEDLHQVLESFASDANKGSLLGLTTDFHDFPPLVMVAEMSHQECVKALLILGSKTDAIYRKLRATALHFAAQRNLSEAVSSLLEAGSSLCLIDREHRTALYWASMSSSEQVVKILLAHMSADSVEAKDIYSFTAFTLVRQSCAVG